MNKNLLDKIHKMSPFETKDLLIDVAQKSFKKNKDKTKKYINWKLIKQKDMNEFSWEILPYGRYSIYKKLAMKYKKFKLGFLKLLLK